MPVQPIKLNPFRLKTPGLLFGRKKPFKVGVYLGSFNPIHLGHLQLGKTARDQEHLDAVEFVALRKPIHKAADFMSDEDRHTINQLAVASEEKLFASNMDIQATSPTLEDYVKQYPLPQAKLKLVLQRTLNLLDAIRDHYEKRSGRPVELSYIVGADGLASYPQAWNEPEFGAFLKKCKLLIAPRPGAPSIRKTVKALRAIHPYLRRKILKIIPCPISSSQIRTLIEQGKPVPSTLVPKAVSRFLYQHRKRLLKKDAAA